jgi:hypothetical protein
MSLSEPILFKRFNDAALAGALTDLLDANDITYIMQESTPSFDPAFRNDELTKEYSVKINAEDFGKVNQLLEAEALAEINGVDKDYYLFTFTDAELMEVLTKADEWNPFDYQLAKKILADRGVKVNQAVLSDLKEQRLDELKKPEPSQTGWIIIGYLVSLAGGVLGIFIGWYLATAKKTLPNGERVYEFKDGDRLQGKWIMYISIAVFVLAVLYRIWPSFTQS